MPDPTNTSTDFQVLAPVSTTPLVRGRSRISDIALLARWRRRRLIHRIEQETDRSLLCYVSHGPRISRDDVLDIHALLDALPPGTPLDLLLHSPGGDVNAAEKLVRMLRAKVEGAAAPAGDGAMRIIVPDWAKSAATLMALGADRIVMSDTSELGPIDPQFVVTRGDRKETYSAWDYLRALRIAEERCRANPDNAVFERAFRWFDPLHTAQASKDIERVRQVARHLLKQCGSNYTLVESHLVAGSMMDPRQFPSHAQMIDFQRAHDIGLRHLRYMEPTTRLWRMYWDLYKALRKVCGDDQKVFESSAFSRIVPSPGEPGSGGEANGP